MLPLISPRQAATSLYHRLLAATAGGRRNLDEMKVSRRVSNILIFGKLHVLVLLEVILLLPACIIYLSTMGGGGGPHSMLCRVMLQQWVARTGR